jgi:hypothetical protein
MLNYCVGFALRSWDRQIFVTALMIGSIGVRTVAGLALAGALNLWMVSRFQMTHLEYSYAVASGVMILLLGQFAVLWPALLVAKLSAGIVTRGMDRISPRPFFSTYNHVQTTAAVGLKLRIRLGE